MTEQLLQQSAGRKMGQSNKATLSIAMVFLVASSVLETEAQQSSNNQTGAQQTNEMISLVPSIESLCNVGARKEDPESYAPDFVVVNQQGSETRLTSNASVEQIRAAGFRPINPIYVLVHGFLQGYPKTKWLNDAKHLFEMHSLLGKQNLVIMDYGRSSNDSYPQVVARAYGLAQFLADFLSKLFEMGAARNSTHLIGHSLGGQIVGLAGKRMQPRVGRISTLDPAGPCFGKLVGGPIIERLGPDDAYEVDVLHYDGTFLGTYQQLGQFDVYVNGGGEQPDAPSTPQTIAQILSRILTTGSLGEQSLSESHSRSTQVASADLSQTNCQMIAYECSNYEAFKAGECGSCDQVNNQCFDMAFHFQYSNREPSPLRQAHPGKRLFIRTSSDAPFCVQHYQVLVRLERSPVNLVRTQRINLELIDDSNERFNLNITHRLGFDVFSHLLISDKQPSRFKSANLLGDNAPRVGTIEINFMSSIEPEQRKELSSRLCPTQESVVDSNSLNQNSITLSEC